MYTCIYPWVWASTYEYTVGKMRDGERKKRIKEGRAKGRKDGRKLSSFLIIPFFHLHSSSFFSLLQTLSGYTDVRIAVEVCV